MRLTATKNDYADYKLLLRSIDAMPIRLCDRGMLTKKNRFVMLRHDIDHDLDHAMRFADVEVRLGYRATYFLLPGAKYFDYSQKFIDQVRALYRMGHEVGLHNNALTAYFQGNANWLEDCIVKPLRFLREVADVPVAGSSAHGDKAGYQFNFVNYEMWKECSDTHRKNDKAKDVAVSMKAPPINLAYEAYFLPKQAYLTDSGHKWAGAVLEDMPPFEWMKEPITREETVERFNMMPPGSVMQLLTHPIWWGVEGA